MARCPYGSHRLVLEHGSCRRCKGELHLLAAVRTVPISLFNRARRLWEEGNTEATAALLCEILRLRPEFAEAHWLMAAVEVQHGRFEEARVHLVEAARLGAAVDLAWIDDLRPDPDDQGEAPAEGA